MARSLRMASSFIFVLLLAVSASGQCSSTLTVGGTLASGGTAIFDVTGAPADAPTVVLISPSSGSFSFGPLLTLGLSAPFVPVAIGATDANGDFTSSLSIPPIPPGTLGILDFAAQAVTIEFNLPSPPSGGGGGGPGGPPFTFCTSNVVTGQISL